MYFRVSYVLVLSTALFFFLVLGGYFFTDSVLAVSPSSIGVSIVPPIPEPLENVNITLSSYANNLDIVLISWFVDGKSAASGTGRKSFSLKAPAAGGETLVLVKIDFPEGEIELRFPVRPSNTLLLWQAIDSYVPPFYRGKALPSPDSRIKVVAMPEIKIGSGIANASDMAYSWKLDYTNDQAGSGYGKSFFIFNNDFLEKSNTVSVVATTADQKYSSEASTVITTANPKILFYKRDPKTGTNWDFSIPNNYRILGEELLQAAPYFIAPKDTRNPRLVWSWSVNGSGVSIPGFKKNVVPLIPTPGLSGTSKLRLTIENSDKIFQSADKEINIEF